MDPGTDAPLQDLVEHFLPAPTVGLLIEPHLDALEAQAVQADRTRSVDRAVIDALKGTDFMRMSATRELGGIESSIHHMGLELEAVAARQQ